MTEVERFWSKVSITALDSCWLWTGSLQARGYGSFYWAGRVGKAHRYAYEKFVGPIPQGKGYHGTCVCHHCDTPGCVNPAHLFLGSHFDNIQDQRFKKRFPPRYREYNGRAKLSTLDVVEIRRLRSEGWLLRELSAKFGVSMNQISTIARGLQWQ